MFILVFLRYAQWLKFVCCKNYINYIDTDGLKVLLQLVWFNITLNLVRSIRISIQLNYGSNRKERERERESTYLFIISFDWLLKERFGQEIIIKVGIEGGGMGGSPATALTGRNTEEQPVQLHANVTCL